MSSYDTLARGFKSPPFVLIASLLKRRSKIRANAKQAIDRWGELERENQQLLLRNRLLSEPLVRADQHATLMQQQRDQTHASVNLPHDPPVGTHGYGPIMIALAVNLAMSIGFRRAARAIRTFDDAFDGLSENRQTRLARFPRSRSAASCPRPDAFPLVAAGSRSFCRQT